MTVDVKEFDGKSGQHYDVLREVKLMDGALILAHITCRIFSV